MRIAIDMQGAQTASAKRGIGRYTLSLVRALLDKCRAEHEILLVFNGTLEQSRRNCLQFLNGSVHPEQCMNWYSPIPISNSSSNCGNTRRIAKYIFSEYILSLKPDFLLITSLFEGYNDTACTLTTGELLEEIEVAVILYDLIPLEMHTDFLASSDYKSFYLECIESLASARLILGISKYSCNQYKKIFPENFANQRICLIGGGKPETAPRKNTLDAGSARTSKLIGREFMLFVGSCDPQKNLAGLMNSLQYLDPKVRDRFNLAICGIGHKESSIRNSFIKSGIKSSKLFVFGECSDDELHWLYSNCHVYILPSIVEGFGLTLTEAIECGAICIASQNSSIPEIIGTSEALFDPKKPREIAQLTARSWLEEDFRNLLREGQRTQISKMSWNNVANRTLKAMEVSAKQKLKSSLRHDTKNRKINSLSVSHILWPYVIADKANVVDIAYCIGHTFRKPSQKRKLLIDVSGLKVKDGKTGVQRVVRGILANLQLNNVDDYIIILVYSNTRALGYFYADELQRRYLPDIDLEIIGTRSSPVEFTHGDVLLVLDLQHKVALYQETYLVDLRAQGVRIYFVIYDLLPLQFPNYFPSRWNLTKLHNEWLKLIGKMDGFLAISKTVQEEASSWFNANIENISPYFYKGYFQLGGDVNASDPSRGLLGDHESLVRKISSRVSFLQVSTLEPRKAPGDLLDAFELLWNKGIDVNLVFVGKRGWLVRDLIKRIIKHRELGEKLFWLDKASDEMLRLVYSSCSCAILASHGEGFGLPIVEAAEYRIPLILRDIPIFREVGGDHAFYFNASSASDLADKIEKWIDLYKKGEHKDSSGIKIVTWAESSQQLLKCIKDALKCNPRITLH